MDKKTWPFWQGFRLRAKFAIYFIALAIAFLVNILAYSSGNIELAQSIEWNFLAPTPLWIFLIIIWEIIDVGRSGHFCDECGKRHQSPFCK